MTNLKQQTLLLQLQRIAQLRLRFSKRWSRVDVTTTEDSIVITWSQPTNTEWQSHTKECPLKDLSKYLRSQKLKLRNEFKNRHNNVNLKP